MARVISVDTGNRYIKTEHAYFTAGLVRHGSTPPAVNSVDTIRYKGQYYSLTNARDSYRRDKTADEAYLVLTMAAIAKELIYSGVQRGDLVSENIVLAMGLPIAHLQRMKKSYAEYFMNNHFPLDFEYNGTQFHITVDDVHVWPQGYSAAIIDRDSYKEAAEYDRAYIIDIGGYTTDVSMLFKGKPDMHYCESIDAGVIHLLNRIKSDVQSECGIELDDIAAETLLRGGKASKNNPVLMKVSEKARREYTDEIIRSLRERGIDFATSFLIFMGGGALLMKPDIESAVNHNMIYFIPNINANAVGYVELTKAQLKRQQSR